MKTLLGATIGSCIHVRGLLAFLNLAEELGYRSIFLGSAMSIPELIAGIKQYQPELVAISYRLNPESARKLFQELKAQIKINRLGGIKYIFGGTPEIERVARESKIFDRIFSGAESQSEIIAYLCGAPNKQQKERFTSSLISRIEKKYPYPLIRHHFGLPSLKDTIDGAREIAEARVLDVLSLGPDQNAQEHFFHPEEMERSQDGAGGVPLRKPEHLVKIYQATRCGNFPLVRCYSGTRDLIKWAKMLQETIHNAWAAIPLFWYSVLDGRSKRGLEEAIRENQRAIRWHARRRIPVEINEAHQWSLRNAPDSVAVAIAFLSAYNAKALGVRHYIAQYMFNTPPLTSPSMDLAKMLAKKELIETLVDDDFIVFTQVRAGLASFSPDPDIAKGQLSASTLISLAMNPHIIHVVGFSEGSHAIRPRELIESCKIVHGVLRQSLNGFPNLILDKNIKKRTAELVREAKILLSAIRELAPSKNIDAFTDVGVLAKAVKIGLLDAPHLYGNPYARGLIQTRMVDGKCVAVDPTTGKVLTETERINQILRQS